MLPSEDYESKLAKRRYTPWDKAQRDLARRAAAGPVMAGSLGENKGQGEARRSMEIEEEDVVCMKLKSMCHLLVHTPSRFEKAENLFDVFENISNCDPERSRRSGEGPLKTLVLCDKDSEVHQVSDYIYEAWPAMAECTVVVYDAHKEYKKESLLNHQQDHRQHLCCTWEVYTEYRNRLRVDFGPFAHVFVYTLPKYTNEQKKSMTDTATFGQFLERLHDVQSSAMFFSDYDLLDARAIEQILHSLEPWSFLGSISFFTSFSREQLFERIRRRRTE